MKKIAALRSETAIELFGDYHQTASGQRPHIDKHTAYSEIKKFSCAISRGAHRLASKNTSMPR